MANAPTYQTSLVSQQVQQREHLFHLFLDHQNNMRIVSPGAAHSFGDTYVHDWAVYDSAKDKILGRAQGMHVGCQKEAEKGWLFTFNMMFTDARFNGSGLKIDGVWKDLVKAGEWAVVGGTGEFAGAQGTAAYVTYGSGETLNWELNIRFVCPAVTARPPNPIKGEKPVGGDGGQAFDIIGQPQRLESITIGAGDVVDSIAFSYIDQAGNKKTSGPWGGNGGRSKTIQFAANENVKKITVKTGNFGGHDVVTSLTFVTNVDTYGPYGKGYGTQFVIPENETDIVVAFFGRCGLFLDQIGIYTTASVAVAEN